MSDALTKLGEAARRAREYISPWSYLSPSDVASNLPGGGIPAAVEPYKAGLQKTAEATKAFREGRWGDAARWYGSGMLDTATAGLSALPEGGAMAKLAALLPGVAVRAWHGSPAAFDKFDMKFAGSKTDPGMLGKGHYLSTDPVVAKGTTDKFGTYGAAPHQYETEVTLQNPLNLDFPSWSADKRQLVSEALGVPYAKGEPFTDEWAQRITDALKAKGHDGVALDYAPVGYNHHEIAVMGDDPIKILSRNGEPIAAQPEGAMQKLSGIRAFHGSPHDFDRFDMSKIGTGEGAQAYGHGLYFAENEGVARSYRDALTRDPRDHLNDVIRNFTPYVGPPVEVPRVEDLLASFARADDASIRALANNHQVARDVREIIAAGRADDGSISDSAMSAYKRLDAALAPKAKGSMYEVRINADPEHFLDWDKPLSEQSAFVQEALKRGPGEPTWRGEKEVFDRFPSDMERFAGYRGSEAYTRTAGDQFGQDMASGAFKQAGIPGIKYLDAGSRGAGDGTRNYVVFDDKLVEIIRKYGWMPGMAIPAAMALEMQQAQEQSAPQM